jgi:hypothetical protein
MDTTAVYSVHRHAYGPFNDLVEFSMLLSAEQASQLEKRALARGMSIGQLLRSIVSDYLRAVPEQGDV